MEKNARILELKDQPFYLATLFLPQLSSEPGNLHPLIIGFFNTIINNSEQAV